MPFSELGLSSELLRALAEANYAEPTPVQAAAIAPILRARDVCACAQTGSGKTAAFALPMLQRLRASTAPSERRVSGLVLVPTRELAMQVGESFRKFSRYLPQPIKVLSVFGGVSINPQMLALRGGADIVVATPGRLLDLADHNAVRLSEVSTLVLDEADRLLDEGFADELTRVLALLPDRRQNLLFSATFPLSVQSLAEGLLRDPVRIDIAAAADTTRRVQQRAIAVDPERRTQLLRHLIQLHSWERTLVFVATKYAAEQLGDVVFVEVPETGRALAQGGEAAVVESVKAASEVYAPIGGEVTAANADLAGDPAKVNGDPEGEGWLFKLRVTDKAQLEKLMTADQYAEFVKGL